MTPNRTSKGFLMKAMLTYSKQGQRKPGKNVQRSGVDGLFIVLLVVVLICGPAQSRKFNRPPAARSRGAPALPSSPMSSPSGTVVSGRR